jgi:transketolase
VPTDMLIAAAEALATPLPQTSSGTVLVGYGTEEELIRYAMAPDWAVHVPGHPDEVRQVVADAMAREDRAYVHVSARANSAAHALTGGFELVREGLDGVVIAVGPTLDPVLRATVGMDLAVLYAATIRPFDEVGLRTAVLAAHHADVVLVEPCLPGASALYVAQTLVHVQHRLLALGGAESTGEEEIARAVRDFVR